MKSYRNIYSQVYDFENLYQAYRAARRAKRDRAEVARFEARVEDRLFGLQRELRDQTYQPGPYHHFYIFEPKRRKISAALFRDRVVHHALVNVIEPLFERKFMYVIWNMMRHSLLLWLVRATLKYPREHRFALAIRTQEAAFEFNELIVLARKTRDKRDLLLRADAHAVAGNAPCDA